MRAALAEDLEFAQAMADRADEIAMSGFESGAHVEYENKADGSPVSAFDEVVERELLSMIQLHHPGDAVLGEEIGAHGAGRRRWVLDGIDGTLNYIVGSPLWGTLIGLVVDDLPTIGIACGPAQGFRWWGACGSGAWARGPSSGEQLRLQVAAAPDSRPIRANLELMWDDVPDREPPSTPPSGVELVPMTIHPALMVADGQIDMMVQAGGGPWDFAALMPIVWEAGGQTLDGNGQSTVTPMPPITYVGNLTRTQAGRIIREAR